MSNLKDKWNIVLQDRGSVESKFRLLPPAPAFRFSGGCVERVTPVPIPNTEVKPLGADGTARATVWESRKPPGLFKRRPAREISRAFSVWGRTDRCFGSRSMI